MRAEQHQGENLTYVAILPDDYDPQVSYPLVVMLHGFGANMLDLAGLAPSINPKGYVYACPNAPMVFDLGLGNKGYGWMTPHGKATPQEIQRSEALLSGFFEEVSEKFKTKPGRALLMGFSQGGGMTLRCGLGRPGTFAGLVALSSYLPNPEELEDRLPARRSQPIFFAHGRSDSMVSTEHALASVKFLERMGYRPDYREYPMGHEISPPVLKDLTTWMAGVLPPISNAG